MTKPLLSFSQMNDSQRLVVRALCEADFGFFVRFMFYQLESMIAVWNWHHELITSELAGVFTSKYRHLIINCPPGSNKTEVFSIHFAPWCIIQSIKTERDGGEGFPTRWLPTGYSAPLIEENTARMRSIVMSEVFQDLWPMVPSPDTFQKHNWAVQDEFGHKHSVYGGTPEGQITGRRAGYMIDKPGIFTGAVIADDPLPPKADGSFIQVDRSNKLMNRILRSRRAMWKTPIIMIQQRIGIGDTTDFLMSEKTPDTYRKVVVPAVIDREYIDALSPRIKALCIADTGFKKEPVSYWEWKEPIADLLALRKADTYLFSSQYQQDPDEAMLEGLIWRQQVETMIADGRALDFIPIEPALPVNTLWDLGMNNDMVIWLYQTTGFEIRLVAFYKNNNIGIEHYINWLHDFRDKFGIRFGVHYGPHDLAVREFSSGVSRIDTAKLMGLSFIKIDRPKLKRDSIEGTRPLFARLWIDTKRCEIDCLAPKGETKWHEGRGGWSALKKYQREWFADKEIFGKEPMGNWASHPNDALMNLAQVKLGANQNKKPLMPYMSPRRFQ